MTALNMLHFSSSYVPPVTTTTKKKSFGQCHNRLCFCNRLNAIWTKPLYHDRFVHTQHSNVTYKNIAIIKIAFLCSPTRFNFVVVEATVARRLP